VTGQDLVERIDERRGIECSEHASHRPGKPDFGEERDATSGVAGNRRSVAEDEPPAVVPRLLGHGSEQAAGLSIGERQQSKLFTSVEPGDDTRRPAAELSGAGIEHNRAREPHDRHVVLVGMRVS
jgi:hypothetical protein